MKGVKIVMLLLWYGNVYFSTMSEFLEPIE